MKTILKIVLCMMFGLIISGSMLPVCVVAKPDDPPIIGMVVRSNNNEDFPQKPNLPTKILQNQLRQIIDYAINSGYNSIFFEVRTKGEALYASDQFPTSRFLVGQQGTFTIFDPLRELLRLTSGSNLKVYALIDPFYLGENSPVVNSTSFEQPFNAMLHDDRGYFLNPADPSVLDKNSQDINQLWKKYGNDLSGIIFQNMDIAFEKPDAARGFIEDIKLMLPAQSNLGILFSGKRDLIKDTATIKESLDVVIAEIDAPIGFSDENIESMLTQWKIVADHLPLILYYDIKASDSITGEYCTRVFIAENAGVQSRLFDGYTALRFGNQMQGALLSSMFTPMTTMHDFLSFKVPKQLTISRPTSKLTTSLNQYSIFGTSDPNIALTMNGHSVERISQDGIFSVRVALKLGNNTFIFKQGSQNETVTINRVSDSAVPAPISSIRSMTPQISYIVHPGENIEMRCIAPSGAIVSANILGNSVELEQSAWASKGVPAVFTGEITFEKQPDRLIEDIGSINYTMYYDQRTSYYKSSGTVYLVSNNAKPFVRVSKFVASVFYDEKAEAGNYKEVYKRQTTEEIVGQFGDYYALASGGFIRKDDVEVLTSELPVEQNISKISAFHDKRSETFTLIGAKGLPYHFIENENGSTTLKFFGDLMLPENIETKSDLFYSVEWKHFDSGIECILTPFSPDSVWGLDVFYHNDDTVIYAKKTPILSDESVAVLKDICVVLDPGHGGIDPGALSVLGEDYPTERELNFANALMLKKRLEQLGATVILTRDSNTQSLTLFERMQIAQDNLPDFFISIHHNSVSESADVHKASGVESYYYYDFGRHFGEAVTKRISLENFDRQLRSTKWSYYTVTRMRYSPSILTEIAFMPHPVEYVRACDTVEIFKTANAIVCAMLQSIQDVK